MSDIDYKLRFGGIERLYGAKALNKFAQSHLCVIGVGGVGSWVVESIARSGVGRLTLIDPDEVSQSNINRQLVALDSTLGMGKAEVLVKRIAEINPACQVTVIEDLLKPENTRELISHKFDYVIDAIDSARSKAALIRHCKSNKIKLICIGGAGGKIDPTQVGIADITRTHNDPLLAKTRSILRYDYNYSRNPKRKYQVPCVYSTEQAVYPMPDGSITQAKPDSERALKMACDVGMGSVTHVTATFANFAVGQVLAKLALQN
ncbi:tRNA cyclic N6-threonylcarbamoyladenosine(37) synthase TcdA [Kangiella sp. TOML190]|uniref:tRNA cyclic N6-threonylcarbamoyladenosine(37) synthase TcdA n=1 Tax=Kangiella sp. TOML190 TaxID=2931351 RepID=UPI002040132C|nr:tRNA cyclic N6-threonylcarbamoyladenosine(37) synthase TcdA [Kangiella sp. TOML190]